jgi:hypothetical protein
MAARRIEFDSDMFERMCHIQCTQEEIAHVLGMSVDTLDRRVKEHYNQSFADVFNTKREYGKMSLRHKMYQTGMDGSVPMLIWLSKQWLGMREPKQEFDIDTNTQVIDQIKELTSKI